MALYKICTYCEQKYLYDGTCGNGCYAKAKAKRNKQYDKTKRRNKEVYHDTRWTLLTGLCKRKFSGLDIYQYYVNNKIVCGKLSHHIETVEDNEARRYDLSNLIYLSSQSHKEIHQTYDKSDNDKKDMQSKLFELVARWEKQMGGIGG